jgi:hypothetical protein
VMHFRAECARRAQSVRQHFGCLSVFAGGFFS